LEENFGLVCQKRNDMIFASGEKKFWIEGKNVSGFLYTTLCDKVCQ
jgi:hypothetical protein